MGWIRKTPTGYWKACWRDPAERTPSGALAIRSKQFRRREDARSHLATVESSKARGTYINPRLGRTTLAEFWPKFLESSPHLRPSTVNLYSMLARRYLLPRFGYRQLATISPLDVRAWVGDELASGVGAST